MTSLHMLVSSQNLALVASACSWRLTGSSDESSTSGVGTTQPSVSKDVAVATARRLLALACQQGAAQLIAYLLPIAAADTSSSNLRSTPTAAAVAGPSACGCKTDAYSSMPSSSASACSPAPLGPETAGFEQRAMTLELVSAKQLSQPAMTAADSAGLTLLHHAVRSGSLAALSALLSGSKQLGIDWQVRPSSLDLLTDSRLWLSIHSFTFPSCICVFGVQHASTASGGNRRCASLLACKVATLLHLSKRILCCKGLAVSDECRDTQKCVCAVAWLKFGGKSTTETIDLKGILLQGISSGWCPSGF